MSTFTEARDSLAPLRLWSLWDMIIFEVEQYIHLAREVGRLSAHLTTIDADQERSKEHLEKDVKQMTDWEEKFANLNLLMCANYAGRIVKEISEGHIYCHGDMGLKLRELGIRLEDECGLRRFLNMPDESWKWYEPSEPLFGTEIDDKLPAVAMDIAEAGKCLGLKRPTACVFHLMRVMEVGVQRLGRKLKVEKPEGQVWQIILDQINSAISKMPSKSPKKKIYASIASNLFNVKLAWRNEVMHPKAVHTVEDAEMIFLAVKGFMRDLITVL